MTPANYIHYSVHSQEYQNNVNPFPECDNYEQLAEDFADHFMTKIKNIQDSLDIFPK